MHAVMQLFNSLHALDQQLPLNRSLVMLNPPCRLFAAVLGRFVYALNIFCKETYGMDYDVSDYWVYEFAKVGCSCTCPSSSCSVAPALTNSAAVHLAPRSTLGSVSAVALAVGADQ